MTPTSCIDGQCYVTWHGGAVEKITKREKDLIDAAYRLGRQRELEAANESCDRSPHLPHNDGGVS